MRHALVCRRVPHRLARSNSRRRSRGKRSQRGARHRFDTNPRRTGEGGRLPGRTLVPSPGARDRTQGASPKHESISGQRLGHSAVGTVAALELRRATEGALPSHGTARLVGQTTRAGGCGRRCGNRQKEPAEGTAVGGPWRRSHPDSRLVRCFARARRAMVCHRGRDPCASHWPGRQAARSRRSTPHPHTGNVVEGRRNHRSRPTQEPHLRRM